MSSEYSQDAIGAAIAASASKTMYIGGGMGSAGFVLDSQLFGLLGLLLALGGFVVNWCYRQKEHDFKRREDARRQAEHDAKMGLYE